MGEESSTIRGDIVGAKWQQLKGQVRAKWGELTDDEIDQIQGKFENLVGTLREKYGYTQEKAEREAKQFFDDIAA